MPVWSDLTEGQQKEAVERVCRGEDKWEVATAFGLLGTSFARKLRQLRAIGEIDDYAQSPADDDVIGVDRSSFTEDGNEASLEWVSKGDPISTLPGLIASHQIDLSVWLQHGPVTHNVWTTPRARRGADGFEYFQNHQVKARFIKKNPVPIFPVISPIEMSVSFDRPPEPRREGLGVSFVVPDAHFGFVKDLKTAKLTPFHNRRVLDVCVQLITEVKPDRVDILGDWLDMAEWTDKFMRDPEFYWTTQPALLEASWQLAQIRAAAPLAEIRMHQGNHDLRLESAIKTHLPAAYGLKAVDELDRPPALSVQKLLALDKLLIEWIPDYPNDQDWVNRGLAFEHGARALSPGNTAKRIVQDAHETHVFGHIHRREMMDKTIHAYDGPVRITAFCPGCLCWTDGRVPGSTKTSQWQNGASVVEYEIDGTANAITPIFIEADGRAIFRGAAHQGRDRLEEIRASMDGWNV